MQGSTLTCSNWNFFIMFSRRLSLSSSNLVLDSKPIELPTRFTPDLLKNGSSHPSDALESSQLLETANSNRAVYVQRKRRPALEASRVGGAPERGLATFPEGPVSAMMRKAQSVHDLVHEGKDMGWNEEWWYKSGNEMGGFELKKRFELSLCLSAL